MFTQEELLAAVKDPGVFSQRLKELVAKVAEATSIHEQAVASVKEAEAKRKEAEDLNSSTMGMLKDHADKSEDLAKREKALADRIKAHEDREHDFSIRTEAFGGFMDQQKATFEGSKQQFADYVAQQEAQIEALKAKAQEDYAGQKASLEAEYQGKLSWLAQREQEIDETQKRLLAAETAANSRRAEHDSIIDQLKKIIKG